MINENPLNRPYLSVVLKKLKAIKYNIIINKTY